MMKTQTTTSLTETENFTLIFVFYFVISFFDNVGGYYRALCTKNSWCNMIFLFFFSPYKQEWPVGSDFVRVRNLK